MEGRCILESLLVCFTLGLSHNIDATASEYISLNLESVSFSKYKHELPDVRVIGVEVKVKLSSSPCKAGESFGHSDHTVWVDKGCRAEFLVFVEAAAEATSTELYSSFIFSSVVSSQSVPSEMKHTASEELFSSFFKTYSTENYEVSTLHSSLTINGTVEESTALHTETLSLSGLETSVHTDPLCLESGLETSLHTDTLRTSGFETSPTDTLAMTMMSFVQLRSNFQMTQTLMEADFTPSSIEFDDGSVFKDIANVKSTVDRLFTIEKPYDKTTGNNLSFPNKNVQELDTGYTTAVYGPKRPTKGCCCKLFVSADHHASLQGVISRIKSNLQVPVKNLSRFRRKKTSAGDNRVSSVSIGSTGIVLLFLLFAFILVSDVVTMFRHCSNKVRIV